MKIIRSPRTMTIWSERLRRDGMTIGLVPTMGALHEGHRSLIRAARLQCDGLVVSIFVNPTQFGPTEDLAEYPRLIAKDHTLCRTEGVDVCFEPSPTAMYPGGFKTTVTVPAITRRWEGKSRPHHFPGVATVIVKLFGIVRPHRALFGQKDYQQSTLARQLALDLNLNVQIIVRPTVRERDGLALSSRNVYLSPEERRIAPLLYHALQAGRQAIERGARDARRVQEVMKKVIAGEPGIKVDYLAVCNPVTLEPLTTIDRQAVLLGAVRIGSVRLIDNVAVRRTKG